MTKVPGEGSSFQSAENSHNSKQQAITGDGSSQSSSTVINNFGSLLLPVVGIIALLVGAFAIAPLGDGESNPADRELNVIDSQPDDDDSYQTCTQAFTNPAQASSIVEACNTVLHDNPEDIESLISRAQANAVLNNDEAADADFKKVFHEVMSSSLNRDPSTFSSEERQISFLKAFWPEYKSLVVNESGQCYSAEKVYETPLNAYRYILSSPGESIEIEKGELFGILEKAHFISERDGNWHLASQLYDLILEEINPYSINALLGKVHAHLMGGTELDLAEKYLDRIKALYPQELDVQAKVQYHRGSVLARKGDYEGAEKAYREVVENEKYASALIEYPILKVVALRDRAFALYASDKPSEAAQVFQQALDVLDQSSGIDEHERNDRRQQIATFLDGAISKNVQLQSYIDYGYVFSHLIAHETVSEEHAFFEHEHDKFYGCLQGGET